MTEVVNFLLLICSLLVALTVHEAAHALVAYYLGDPTAKHEGRVTLNPIKHLDLVGSLVFLFTGLIGWGKPVPVNAQNFRHPMRDSALTALAGPVSNLILAFLLALFLHYFPFGMPYMLNAFIFTLFNLNVFLAVFNFLPLPPLDGSKIIGLFVPRRFYPQYEAYLEEGVKFFVAIIIVDGLILKGVLGSSILASVVGYLHSQVSLLILLST